MKRLSIFFILMLSFVAIANAVKTTDTKHALSKAHEQWLDEVHWIMSDYEKNAFLSLKSENDRDRFVKEFWLHRDPTPGTERNEFREEHYVRLEHANKQFGRETTLPGWKTDRGRAYILLGKPEFTKRFAGESKTHPLELWHYSGYEGYGLPSSFYLLFFQKNSVGPYRIHSPFHDGVRELFIQNHETNSKPDEELLDDLRRDVDPEVGHAVLTPIPSESGNLYLGYGNMDAALLQAKLQNARNYEVEKRTYVEAFIHDRPSVQVYVSMDMKGVHDAVYWFQAPNGFFYLDYAVEYEPDKLDMGHYDDYYTSLTVDGSISTNEKQVVDRILGTHEIKVNDQQFAKIKSIPFQYHGRRPLIPGSYDFTLVVSNNVSRRSATFVNKITIPDLSRSTSPYIPPVIPVRLVEQIAKDEKIRPFQFGEKLLYPNIAARYGLNSQLQVFHQVVFPDLFAGIGTDYALHYVIQRGDQVEYEAQEPLAYNASQLAGNAIEIQKDIPLKGLSLGAHRLVVQLKQDDKVLAAAEPLVFTVDPTVTPGVWKFSVGMPEFQDASHKVILAGQLARMERSQEALALLEVAHKQNPTSSQTQMELIRAALKANEFEKVLEMAGPLEVKDPRNKELLWMMGWGHYGLNHYSDAVRFFERLRLEDPNRVEVLNLLADIYYRMNQPEKSLERVQQSLALKPEQKAIQELKERLESNK